MSAREEVRRALKTAAARLPDLFKPGTRLVVGFSGGQDSTCLLHALAYGRFRLEIMAAHVDHGLRAESAEAARRVAASARSMDIEVHVERIDVAAYRSQLPTRWSVQQAARAARYQALASVAHEQGAAAVLVAHTADDQAETLLLNLLRGTGLAGLAGMRLDERLDPRRLGPPLPEITPPATELRLARPLLGLARSTTLAYCAELGLEVVEDASNQSLAYTRNRVRLELLPALERFNPAIRTVLARTADLVAEDVAALDAIVAELDPTVARARRPGELEYDLRAWRKLPRGLQRRLLRRALETLQGELIDVRASPIEDALDVLRSASPGQTYHLPHGVELCIGTETFVLRLHGRALGPTRPNTWGIEIPRV